MVNGGFYVHPISPWRWVFKYLKKLTGTSYRPHLFCAVKIGHTLAATMSCKLLAICWNGISLVIIYRALAKLLLCGFTSALLIKPAWITFKSNHLPHLAPIFFNFVLEKGFVSSNYLERSVISNQLAVLLLCERC